MIWRLDRPEAEVSPGWSLAEFGLATAFMALAFGFAVAYLAVHALLAGLSRFGGRSG